MTFIATKLFHKAGEGSGGGGGGDIHNLGWYATPEALRAAHPTASNGDWAIVGSTDTVWVWDTDSTDWKDTDSKAEVTPDMVIIKSATMPSASSTPAKAVYQYTGATNATYTHGYIYENVKTATYTGTVSFEAATLSGTTVACSGDNFAAFLTEAGADPTPIVSGTMTYEADATGWRLVGKDSNGDTVTTFLEYVEDYQDAGFTFTGTPQDGDVVAFTCSVTEGSVSYAWNRIDVQPAPSGLPDQTGNAGKFLTTDGTDASWGNSLISSVANTAPLKLRNTSNGGTLLELQNHYTPIRSLKFQSVGTNSFRISAAGQLEIDVNFLPTSNNSATLGYRYSSNAPVCWSNVFTKKISSSVYPNDIIVPEVAGTMAVIQVNTTITLAAADWSAGTQTVSVTGMTATGIVLVSPDPTDQSAYTSAGIICSAQAANSLTFTCSTTPSADLSVNVVML